MTKPLLVVAHEATRTGAPRVLLDLLGFLADRIPVPVAIQLEAEGPLSSDLRNLADTEVGLQTPAAVLVNGAAAAGTLHRVPAGTPAMVYVHEERAALDVLPGDCVVALAERCNRVLCVSERSRVALQHLGIDPLRIGVLPPAVPARATVSDADIARSLHELGLDADRPLVLGCGEAGWRKGADLFVDVARRVRADLPAQFAWAGRRPRAFARMLDADTRLTGVSEDLRWLGELDDVGPILSAAQVLAMTSREDPQPLVPLEAAAMGTVTAGFAIGGIGDLAEAGAAVAVKYPDTVALAREVTLLLEHPEQRARTASAAERRRTERHSIDVVGEQFLVEILSLVGGTEP